MRFKRFFLYLTGQPPPPLARTAPELQDATAMQKEKDGGWWNIAGGVFSGIRNSVAGQRRADSAISQDDYFQEGEVHADLVKVCVSGDIAGYHLITL